MKTFIALVFMLIMIACVQAQTTQVDIVLTEEDLVLETYRIKIITMDEYDSFELAVKHNPLSIDFDGEYTIEEREGYYAIIFDKEIHQGENSLEFSLLFDDLIQNLDQGKVFRTSLGEMYSDSFQVSVTLPRQAALFGEPSIIPQAQGIHTDGQRMTIEWLFEDEEPNIIIFYDIPSQHSAKGVLILAILAVVIAVVLYFVLSKRTKKIIQETLSADEQAIIKLVRKGVSKQKDIARTLHFSKSKMSKVVRKLEEKGLIEKTPYFKTNKLKIKKI